MVRAMFEMEVLDRKRAKHLMLMLGLNYAIDRLCIGRGVCCGWLCTEKCVGL